MKFWLEKAIFVNRAPFDNLVLEFVENEVAVLTAVNGRGKTTLLSHIVDALYEIAKPHFFSEFETKQNKFYRISSAIHNLNINEPSFVYFRFKLGTEVIDYIDIRNNCTSEQYNQAIQIENKIPFGFFADNLSQDKFIKTTSANLDKQKADLIFLNNLATYFPSYRFEVPGYLNEPYKAPLEFKKFSGYAGYLLNPIEVVTGLSQLANWIMDVVLDLRLAEVTSELILFNNLNLLISKALVSKRFGELRFGVGNRTMGGSRIQIIRTALNQTVYPSIFNLSSGESSLLCLFGELLRQADNHNRNIHLTEIKGIVLIDEIDKHLHIKLQKEILPLLLQLFPNVQFIVSSHSPFLSMGLAETLQPRSRIFDLDNFGISIDPFTSEIYNEVYSMMIKENDRFKEHYLQLQQDINLDTRPLIVTEGKTDVKHIRKAKEILNVTDCDITFYEIADDWGDSKLKLLLEQLSKIPQSRKIIGIFDRDVSAIVTDIEGGQQNFKNYGNNVYAFCIPVPVGREDHSNISIEFYYSDDNLKKEKDGRQLYFDNEVDYLHNKSLGRPEIRKANPLRIANENNKKVFDENKMCEVSNWIQSKAAFAQLVETDHEFITEFNFANFNLIFDRIKLIIA